MITVVRERRPDGQIPGVPEPRNGQVIYIVAEGEYFMWTADRGWIAVVVDVDHRVVL
jgi:hypothetical protein